MRWLVRDPKHAPGSVALPTLCGLALPVSIYAFAVGEQALATGASWGSDPSRRPT